MKLLLTGLPGVGKTALLESIIPLVTNPFWVLCREIRNAEGRRVGFDVETSTGLKGQLAHKQDIEPGAMVGDYRVDLAAVDGLLSGPIAENVKAGRFLIVDEIGRIQMLSSEFADTIRKMCAGDSNFIATIRHGDDWTREFTERADVITLVLTPKNREQAKAAVAAMLTAQAVPLLLTDKQERRVLDMAKNYAKAGEAVQLAKLYKNAVRYVGQHKVHQMDSNKFIVAGNHDAHTVLLHDGAWQCDCDLYNGRGQFAGMPGECSHLQAVKLFQDK